MMRIVFLISFVYFSFNACKMLLHSNDSCSYNHKFYNVESYNFYYLIDSYSEKRSTVDESGFIIKKSVTWRNLDNIYDIYYSDIAKVIDTNPVRYFYYAIKVLSDSEYDQTQKLFSIILMQHLPINKYICLMKVANDSFDKGHLDKDVLKFAIFPDKNIKNGTSVYYWWLPALREEFKRNAFEVADKESIDEFLSGWMSLNLIMQK